MKIGVISAMDVEHARLVSFLTNTREVRTDISVYTEGRLGANEIVSVRSGIGKVNAAVGASELIRHFAPDCIISSGVAGGIDASVRVMDVVVGAEMVYHDVWCGDGNEYGQVQGLPAVYGAAPELLKHALALDVSASGSRLRGGLICTGDYFVSQRTMLEAIKARFPRGLAVDMESAAIAQTCYLYGVPFLSFRIISDTVGVENHSEQYAHFWGSMAERSFHTVCAFLSSLPERL